MTPEHRLDRNSDAVVSGIKPDKATLSAIDHWIEKKHPADCESLLEALLPPDYDYATTATRLLAHCVEHHDVGLSSLARYEASSFAVHDDDVGLRDALRMSQDRLLDELMRDADELERAEHGAQATLTLLRALDADRFSKAWEFLWTPRPPQFPRLAGVAVRAAAWSTEHSRHYRKLLDEDVTGAYTAVPQEVLFSLARAPALVEVRDGFLARILGSGGLRAAKLLIRNSRGPDPSPVVLEATRLVLELDPGDETAPVGVAHCLGLDLRAVVPTIVTWMNSDREYRHIDHPELRWRLRDYAETLLPACAEDAIKQPEAWQSVLAQMHYSRLRRYDVIADWLQENIDREEATRYSAALVIEALSAMHLSKDEALATRLQAVANRLHRRAGARSKDDLIREQNLSDPALGDRANLIAIAVARDVLEPPEPVDVALLRTNIKALPYTYAALGGPALDKDLEASRLPVWRFLYLNDLEALQGKLDEELNKGLLPADRYRWLWDHWESIRLRRDDWESDFKAIAAAGVEITSSYSRKLRENPYIWNEVRVLARLVSQFDVTLEPKNLPGMGKKRPEFLLESPDGPLIFELATIGDKPSDLRTGVKTSSGGEAKRTLNDKLKRQFGGSKTGIALPVVLGIQMRHALDLEFDLTNSLYGPLAVSFAVHRETGEVAKEGTTRDVEKAFFAQENVGCISAVAGIAPQTRENRFLVGGLYRPLKEPDEPLALSLWVRLRTALFGPRPAELVEEMGRIPGITPDEADVLIDAGVDSYGFFAAERLQKPESLPIDDGRWEELVDAAQHQQLLASTSAIWNLRAAKGVDLSPLERERIYLFRQLYENLRPSDFPLETWTALMDEVEHYVGRPGQVEPTARD